MDKDQSMIGENEAMKYMLEGMISNMDQVDRDNIESAKRKIREIVDLAGDQGRIALTLVGLELQLETEE